MKTNRRGFLGWLGAGAASLGVLKAGGNAASARVAGPVANAAKVADGGEIRMEQMSYKRYSENVSSQLAGAEIDSVLTGDNLSWLGVNNWVGLMNGKHEIDMEGMGFARQLVAFEFVDGGGMGNTKTVYFETFRKAATIDGLGIFDAKVGGHLLHTTKWPWRNGRRVEPGDSLYVSKHDLNVSFS